jgi:two-component system, sensor histidine kinase PdtaS
MPQKTPVRCVLIVLVLSTLFQAKAFATRGDDSLQWVLNSASAPADRAKALLQMAARYRDDRPSESLLYTHSALGFAQQANDPLVLHAVHLEQCSIHFRLAAYDDLLQDALIATELSQRIGDARLIAADLQWLTMAYEQLGEFDTAVNMSKKALVTLRTTGDSSVIGKAILEVMNALVKAGRYDEVIRHGEEADRFFEAKDDTIGRCQAKVRSAEGLLARGRYADAVPFFHFAARGMGSSAPAQELARIALGLSEAYCGMGRYNEAHAQLDSAEEHYRSGHMPWRTPRVLALRSRISEGSGDLAGALSFQRQHAALKDSIMNERVAERMAGLSRMYDIRAKEAENEVLRSKNEEHTSEIASARTQGFWWLLVSAVLVGALALLIMMLLRFRKAVRRTMMRNKLINAQAQEITKQNLDLQRQNLRLAETLVSEEEKDMLLREIHHRVKNNLQIVNALLRVQGAHLGDAKVEQLLAECQSRIRSIANVHELLYRAGDVKCVSLSDHITAIADGILGTYGLRDRITLQLRMAQERFPIDTLTPLGLIITELITNSAKYAFGDHSAGSITIELRAVGDHFELKYSDNGPGPSSQRFFDGTTFGLELVRTLADQMSGSVRLQEGKEPAIVLVFMNEALPALRAAS